MTTAISIILAILKAIPTVDSLFQSLMASYAQQRWTEMKKENADAIIQVIVKHDQRTIEIALGSATAGKVSGDAGATIVDSPPAGTLPH